MGDGTSQSAEIAGNKAPISPTPEAPTPRSTITRRGFLAGAAAFLGGLGLPKRANATPESPGGPPQAYEGSDHENGNSENINKAPVAPSIEASQTSIDTKIDN